MLIVSDRVHSNNYGDGTVIKVYNGDYPMAVIKLDGLSPWFAEGHIVHCALNGVRDIANDEADPEVDFFVIYPESKPVNIEQLSGYDPEVGPDTSHLFTQMMCNDCKIQWDTKALGHLCPDCGGSNVSDLMVWRQTFSRE